MKNTKIRLRRIENHISNVQAIEYFGISKSTFYKLEEGYAVPSLQLVIKMSKLYKCTVDEILKDLELLET